MNTKKEDEKEMRTRRARRKQATPRPRAGHQHRQPLVFFAVRY